MVKYKMGKKTGTKEWAKTNINISTGCSHGCKYCYARQMKVRFGQVAAEDWTTEVIDESKVLKNYRKINNNDPSIYDIMTPTVHDVTKATLPGMVTVLKKVLSAGNSVVIVSKPHLDCIKELVAQLSPWKAQIVFRFTITSKDDTLLKYWEPGAPGFNERLESLKYAHNSGFVTSVSAEPSLYLPGSEELVRILEPHVSETIWIGKMNQIKARVKIVSEEDVRMVERIIAGQTDEEVLKVYDTLKNHPKVRWKDSIKAVLSGKAAVVSCRS